MQSEYTAKTEERASAFELYNIASDTQHMYHLVDIALDTYLEMDRDKTLKDQNLDAERVSALLWVVRDRLKSCACAVEGVADRLRGRGSADGASGEAASSADTPAGEEASLSRKIEALYAGEQMFNAISSSDHSRYGGEEAAAENTYGPHHDTLARWAMPAKTRGDVIAALRLAARELREADAGKIEVAMVASALAYFETEAD